MDHDAEDDSGYEQRFTLTARPAYNSFIEG